jgi:hypothetical protein
MSNKKKTSGRYHLWAVAGLLLLWASFIIAGCKTTEKPNHNVVKYGGPPNYRDK